MKFTLAITAVILFILGASVALGFLMAVPRDRRLRRMAAARDPNQALASFREAFSHLPEAFVRSAYTLVRDLVGIMDFPVQADDDLWRILELDQGDVDHKVESFFEQLGRTAPDATTQSGPINTVRELVEYLYRHVEAAEHAA